MIEFKNVSKKYKYTKAIDELSIKIEENGIYCLLGRNGAGKTTFMKLIAGHIKNFDGEIEINSRNVLSNQATACVNFIENNSDYFNMSVESLLEAANELQDNFDLVFAHKMAKKLELDMNKHFNDLSLGMKVMLTTILCLSNNSEIVLLDEPVLGFDAIMRKQFNMLLQESFESHERTIIVSTHLIDEIANICHKLIIIDNGKKLFQSDITEIDEKAYTLTGKTDVVIPFIKDLNCIGTTTINDMTVAHIFDNWIEPPLNVRLERLNLQDFFINIVGGNIYE